LFVACVCEQLKAPPEGTIHHFIFADGVTLATWVLALLALIPLLSLVDAMKSRKLDNSFRRIQWLDSQFNSVAMIASRRETGNNVLGRDPINDMKQSVPTSGWPIIAFLIGCL
jgi:hypothetical protein